MWYSANCWLIYFYKDLASILQFSRWSFSISIKYVLQQQTIYLSSVAAIDCNTIIFPLTNSQKYHVAKKGIIFSNYVKFIMQETSADDQKINVQGNNALGQTKLNPSDPSTYTFYHPLLVKLHFFWSILIFIIDIYYVNECFFWPTFHTFYQYSLTSLLSLNIIFMSILLAHIVYIIAMTPTFKDRSEDQNVPQWRKQLKHYFNYNSNGIFIIMYVLFLISFFLPRAAAQYLHLIYLFRLIQMSKFLSEIYNKIHSYKWMRILYSLTIMFYNIIYFSHFLGCIFYVIDQLLIQSQYFGDPALYPDNYYQYISLSFTPIESLSYLEKYIMAFYFSSGLVTSIAYGDIVGKNYIEDAYVLILLVLSTIVIAFILEEFMIMVGNNRFQIFEIIKKYKNLRELMSQKHVQENLQIKIRNYLFYVEYYNKFHNSSDVFSKLSTKLQVDLYEYGYCPLFLDLLRPLGVTDARWLTQTLSEVTYQPETEIQQAEWKARPSQQFQELMDKIQSEVLQADFICLLKGKMYQYLQYGVDSAEFQFRRTKNHYNFYQFMANRKVRYGLRSKSLVRAIVLSKQMFTKKLQEKLGLRKQIINQRENIIANSRSRSLFQDDCEVCDDHDHSVTDCPQVHYVIDGTIQKARKIPQILNSKINSRRSAKRSSIQSKRQINIIHLSVLFGNINFEAMNPSKAKLAEQQPLQLVFLSKAIKHILDAVQSDQHQILESDSSFDPLGIDLQWRLPQY